MSDRSSASSSALRPRRASTAAGSVAPLTVPLPPAVRTRSPRAVKLPGDIVRESSTAAAPVSTPMGHRQGFLASIVASAVLERGTLSRFGESEIQDLCLACKCTPTELFEQERIVKARDLDRIGETRRLMQISPRERLQARVHYNPPSATLSPRSRHPEGKSVLKHYIRRPNVGKESEASKASRTEVLNLRRVLNEVQLQLPALTRLQQQRKLDLETEAGQAESFREIFSIIDEDGSGEIDLDEFVAFGKRIGGESAKVFSAKLYHRIVKPDEPGIALVPFIGLLFPAYAAQLLAKELQSSRRAGVVGVGETRSWEDGWPPHELHVLRAAFNTIDADGDGLISVEEIALYAVGKRALERVDGQPAPDLERFASHVSKVSPEGGGRVTFPQFAAMQKEYLDHLRARFEEDRLGRPAAYLNEDDGLLDFF